MYLKKSFVALPLLALSFFISYQLDSQGGFSGFLGYTFAHLLFIVPFTLAVSYALLHFFKKKSADNIGTLNIVLVSVLILALPVISDSIKDKTNSLQIESLVERSSSFKECLALGKLEFGERYDKQVKQEMEDACYRSYPRIKNLGVNFSLNCIGLVDEKISGFRLHRLGETLQFDFSSPEVPDKVIAEIKNESHDELSASNADRLAAKLTRLKGILNIQFYKSGSSKEFICG